MDRADIQGERGDKRRATALLGELSDEFAAELPGLEEATGHLTDDLFKLQQSVDVINTVASARGVIEQIAALVA